MLRYTLRRFAQMVFMLFLLSILVFFLFALMPGDFFSGNRKLKPARLAELRALYGLDQPTIVRYFIWLKNVFHGDFGWSLQYNEPVTRLLKTYMMNSFIVALAAVVIAWIVAVVIGVFSATSLACSPRLINTLWSINWSLLSSSPHCRSLLFSLVCWLSNSLRSIFVGCRPEAWSIRGRTAPVSRMFLRYCGI